MVSTIKKEAGVWKHRGSKCNVMCFKIWLLGVIFVLGFWWLVAINETT